MTASEAYNKFVAENEKLTVISCYEYDSCFVFEAVSNDYAGTEAQHVVFDSTFAVDKASGKIIPFKPYDIPTDEYEQGKKVLIKEMQNHNTFKK